MKIKYDNSDYICITETREPAIKVTRTVRATSWWAFIKYLFRKN